ncbi:hypothetical protein COO60DRAFT_1528505 [Scenedesmus sp. NREL 46B-D3]|nr:hypothetical protein COO60DRAFT_1528505 [Scenedesmus sp. NREL 46B-D3]
MYVQCRSVLSLVFFMQCHVFHMAGITVLLLLDVAGRLPLLSVAQDLLYIRFVQGCVRIVVCSLYYIRM